MGRVFVISDLHLCHNKEFVWQKRGFDSIEAHDLAILENWNKTVCPEDTVYVLDDVIAEVLHKRSSWREESVN